MKTCPYCGSNLKQKNHQQFDWVFCSMTLAASMVKENRERLDVHFQAFALEGYIDWTTPELMTLSTFELLCLLKIIRKKRNEMYHLLLDFYRAGEQESNKEWKAYEKIAGREYLYITKKMFVVENIIRQRLGYVPTRITEKYLGKYLENIENDKNGPMMIRTQRQKKKKTGEPIFKGGVEQELFYSKS